MHAKANGWYFYSGQAAAYEREKVAAGQDYGYSRQLQLSNHDRAARALHIEPGELPTNLATREDFNTFVDSLEETHAHQAQVARAVISSLTDGDRVEA